MVAAAASAYVCFRMCAAAWTISHPEQGDHYQVDTALQAFGNGGLLGRGPGEGRVKDVLPDAHADFVFAVAGEEFGMILCLIILAVRLHRVARPAAPAGRGRICSSCWPPRPDRRLRAAGVRQHGLHPALIPTKGMTLPFISYGGCSALAVALGMGMLLALTRKRQTGTCIGDRMRGPAVHPSSLPPAAPAGMSSRPKRWPRSCCARPARGADDRCALRRAGKAVFAGPGAIRAARRRHRRPRRLRAAARGGRWRSAAGRRARRAAAAVAAVVGFGGYPAVAPVVAATLRRAPASSAA